MGEAACKSQFDSNSHFLGYMLIIVLITFATYTAWAQESSRHQSLHRVEDIDGGERATKAPLIFTSNEILPPMIYLQDGKRIGIVVDLSEAIKRHMNRLYRSICSGQRRRSM